jgi:hypothetical protein
VPGATIDEPTEEFLPKADIPGVLSVQPRFFFNAIAAQAWEKPPEEDEG